MGSRFFQSGVQIVNQTLDIITVSKPKTNVNFTSQESMIQNNDLIKDFIRKLSSKNVISENEGFME